MNRRLRQQRKAPLYLAQRELQRSPWKIFLSGLVLSAILGGLIHLSLSEAVFTRYFQYLLKTSNPSWKFQAQGARLSFSKWGVPRLAVVLDYLELYDLSAKCGNEPKAIFTRLEIPVRFWKWVRTKNLEISTLHAESVSWNEGSLCQYSVAKSYLNGLSFSPMNQSEDWRAKAIIPMVRPNLSDRLFSSIQLEKYQGLVRSMFRTVSEIRSENIAWPKIEVGDLYVNTAVPFEIKDVVVDLQNEIWSARGQLIAFLPQYSKRAYQIPFDMEVGASGLNFQSGRSLGEGNWKISLRVDADHFQPHKLILAIDTKSLPLSLAGALLKKWNRLPLLESLRYVWSNCTLEFKLPFQGGNKLDIHQPGCQFDGKFGSVKMNVLEFDNDRPTLELELSQADVSEWRPYCRNGFECEISQWGGQFSGMLRLIARRGWLVNGTLHSPQLAGSDLEFRDVLSSDFITKWTAFRLRKVNRKNEPNVSMTSTLPEPVWKLESVDAPLGSHRALGEVWLKLLSFKPVGQRLYVESPKGSSDFLEYLRRDDLP